MILENCFETWDVSLAAFSMYTPKLNDNSNM